MPTNRTYNVELIPAEVKDGCVSFLLYDPNSKKYKVEADTLAKLDAEIRRLAKDDFKRTCAVWCNIPRGERKPPGFDKWKSTCQTIVFENRTATVQLEAAA